MPTTSRFAERFYGESATEEVNVFARQYISAGQLTLAGNEYDIVSFYVSSCAQYLVYALLLFGIGWILTKSPHVVIKEVTATASNDDEDDLEEWFEDMKKN